MNRFFALALLVLAAAAILSLPAAAQEPPAAGTVIVVVRGAGGAPAAGARISLASASDTAWAREGAADAQGRITLADVPLGEVSVKAFDAEGQLLASGVGYLESAGEVITLIIGPDPSE